MDKMLRIAAKLRVKTKDQSPFGHAIGKGYSASIFFDEQYFPSKIMECSIQINVGEEGEAVIWTIDPIVKPSGLFIGAHFELKEGPDVGVATGEVLSVSEISLQRQRDKGSGKRGQGAAAFILMACPCTLCSVDTTENPVFSVKRTTRPTFTGSAKR